jgi:hypothetical protein
MRRAFLAATLLVSMSATQVFAQEVPAQEDMDLVHVFKKTGKGVGKGMKKTFGFVRHHGRQILSFAAPLAFFAGPIAGYGATFGTRMLSMPHVQGVAFAPVKLGEKPTRSAVEAAGRIPYLRYTVPSDAVEPVSASIFNQPAYSKETKDAIAALPRKQASELGLTGARTLNEFGTWAIWVILAPNAIISYNPDTNEPLYLNDCAKNGKPWFNRLKLITRIAPPQQISQTPPAVQAPPQVVVNNPPAQVINNLQIPQFPTQINLNLTGLPQAQVIPANTTQHIIMVQKCGDWTCKFKNVGMGIGGAGIGIGVAALGTQFPSAYEHAAKTHANAQIEATRIKGVTATNVATITGQSNQAVAITQANGLVNAAKNTLPTQITNNLKGGDVTANGGNISGSANNNGQTTTVDATLKGGDQTTKVGVDQTNTQTTQVGVNVNQNTDLNSENSNSSGSAATAVAGSPPAPMPIPKPPHQGPDQYPKPPSKGGGQEDHGH